MIRFSITDNELISMEILWSNFKVIFGGEYLMLRRKLKFYG
jgi:hypothetical protein